MEILRDSQNEVKAGTERGTDGFGERVLYTLQKK